MSKTFDVTEALAKLGINRGDADAISVRFVEQELPATSGEPASALSRFITSSITLSVTVGRVNLYRAIPSDDDALD